jgi:hypothetical protein
MQRDNDPAGPLVKIRPKRGPGIGNPERTIASLPVLAEKPMASGIARAEAYVRSAIAKGAGVDLGVLMELAGFNRSNAIKFLASVQDAVAAESKAAKGKAGDILTSVYAE